MNQDSCYRGTVVRVKEVADLYKLVFLKNIYNEQGKKIRDKMVIKMAFRKEKYGDVKKGDLIFFFVEEIKKINEAKDDIKVKVYHRSFLNKKKENEC
jgi:hypothetical protein